MDVLLIELVLWSGLLAFIWGLKEGLGKVESEIEKADSVKRHLLSSKAKPEIVSPELRKELIGRYLNHDIFRFIVVQGEVYEFDRVSPPSLKTKTSGDELYVAPGLIYRPAPDAIAAEEAT